MTGTHRITHISFPDMEETEYHDITSGIAEGSLLLDEILLTSGLNFGEMCSNKFEVQLYNISDVTGQKIVVWQRDLDNSRDIPIFVGYVDSCKQNHSGFYREIIAYDIFYIEGTRNIGQWWMEFWNASTDGETLKDIRTALLEYMEIETVTLPSSGYLNDNLHIDVLPYAPTLTFNVLMKMICTLQATIPNINREGKLEFIELGSTYTDESSNINNRDSLFEEFSTKPIDAVWVYDSSYKIIGFGGSGSQNAYKIQGNLLIDGVENVNAVATSVFEKIRGITYTPGDIRYIVSNLDLKLGDRLYFGSGYTYIFENSLSGPILIEQDSKSGGTQYLEESSNWNSDISSIQSKLTNNTIQYYTFTNLRQIAVNDGDTQKIIDIRFASNESTMVIFRAEILVQVETTVEGRKYYDANGLFRYRYNDLYLDEYKTQKTWVDGDDIIHLDYYFQLQTAQLAHLEVSLNMSGGSVIIPAGGIKSSIYGQGLVASDRWDGTFDIRQVVTQITLPTPSAMRINGVSDVVSVGTQVPTPIMITDEIAQILLGKPDIVTINGVDDTVEIGFIE